MNDVILRELEEGLGADNLMAESSELSAYSVGSVSPGAVVFPGTIEEVAHIVKVAAENNLAIVVRGGGTKMGLGRDPERMDILLCTSRLGKVTDMDTANLTVTAQAGMRFADIQGALAGEENRCYLLVSPNGREQDEVCFEREHGGCFVPLDPPFPDMATLGGIVAANSSGPRRLLYGTVRDMLLGVRFVNAEGKIIGVGGKTVKNVSGYDVSRLIIGSMGTLGVLCEMTLRLLPLPETAATTVMGFRSLDDAFSLVDAIMASQLTPAAIELFGKKTGVRLTPQLQEIGGGDGCFVAVLAEGASEVVERIGADTLDMGARAGSLESVILKGDDHLSFWHDYYQLGRSDHGNGPKEIVVRVSCPISRLKELLGKAMNESAALGLASDIFAHAGSGVGRIIIREKEEGDGFKERVLKWMGRLLELCISISGNLVVEGAAYPWKGELPIWGISRPEHDLVERIKQGMDPARIFSPGRYVGGV